MKVAFVTSSLSRMAGGLYTSMAPLSEKIKERGADIRVFGAGDHFLSEDIGVWNSVDVVAHSTIGPTALSLQPGLVRSLRNFDPDIYHLHGLWTYPSLAIARLIRPHQPVVISPHGMLDKWALGQSRIKKKLAGIAFENRNLNSAACIHALCREEHDSIRQADIKATVATIPNGVGTYRANKFGQESSSFNIAADQVKTLLFLGRLHPKKGIDNLLDAWASVVEKGAVSNRWRLEIAGWGESTYVDHLQSKIIELGISDSVELSGPKFEEQKHRTYMLASAFILPSLSEGLPMAVLEAWLYGLPVLKTPECNLPDGFSQGAAIKLEADTHSITRGLEALFATPEFELSEIGRNGKKLVEERYTWDRVAGEMMDLYHWILGDRDQPGCVSIEKG